MLKSKNQVTSFVDYSYNSTVSMTFILGYVANMRVLILYWWLYTVVSRKYAPLCNLSLCTKRGGGA